MVKDITTQNEQMKSYLLEPFEVLCIQKRKVIMITLIVEIEVMMMMMMIVVKMIIILRLKMILKNNDDYNNNIADNSTMSILYLLQVGVWHTLVGNSYFR